MRVERRRAKVHTHAPDGAIRVVVAPAPSAPRAFSLNLMETAGELDGLGGLVEQLTISHGNPERFHLIKDQVMRRLARMAGRFRAEARPVTETRVWKPNG